MNVKTKEKEQLQDTSTQEQYHHQQPTHLQNTKTQHIKTRNKHYNIKTVENLEENEITQFARHLVQITKVAPLRMTDGERQIWKILESALQVSEYFHNTGFVHSLYSHYIVSVLLDNVDITSINIKSHDFIFFPAVFLTTCFVLFNQHRYPTGRLVIISKSNLFFFLRKGTPTRSTYWGL